MGCLQERVPRRPSAAPTIERKICKTKMTISRRLRCQKYPGDHAGWFRQIRGIATKVILIGNPAGFEAEIEGLRQAGVEIEDRTDGVAAAIANHAIQRAKSAI